MRLAEKYLNMVEASELDLDDVKKILHTILPNAVKSPDFWLKKFDKKIEILRVN